MPIPLADLHGQPTAIRVALAIETAFTTYHTRFKEITLRAQSRFEQQDWHGIQADSVERLDLYTEVVTDMISQITFLLGDKVRNQDTWSQTKQIYCGLIAGREDLELAETFFNSITRRIFTTVGVDPAIEFVDSDFERGTSAINSIYRSYPWNNDTREVVREILRDYRFEVPFQNIELDSRLVADAIDALFAQNRTEPSPEELEIARPVFFRNKAAYIIGRIRRGRQFIPVLLPLLHGEGGIIVDTVLLSQNEASIVFSFTRSYFLVEARRPGDLIDFLKSIMPLKPISELYTSIGYNKHGKTELYRDLLHHLENSIDKFEIARGARGMVMSVFTLPSYDVVFKIIKDRFDYPKKTTRLAVMDRYQLVFRHDRAGRLVDAQEFEHLKFSKDRFSQDLLQELIRVAVNSVTIDDDAVIIKHVYTERRLIPLNIYVREAEEKMAHEAIIDCGTAIKDLAASNIFPGDFLLKNFGVTRHGRVVFYDYDELCLVTDCNFRPLPQSQGVEDEFEAPTWFYVGETDFFPEEFRVFMGLPQHLREVFEARHQDLYTVAYWQQLQERYRAGEVIDIFPYQAGKRFNREQLDQVQDSTTM
ncbi:MAG: bifunctional isocitrate dehydrogenase kinase/phosphatase [Chloroflexi bacterium]|nr:bifunctional isocitrate dehydrogenase kinase/phosphatase [Chloroflexota bacterium]